MNEEDEAFEDLAKRQGDWGMQGSRKHQILRYAENVESKGTSTTQKEIDIMWQKAMQESIKDGEIFTRYHFAEMVAQKALAEHAMREVQRLGQEIEQEPVAIKRMKEWIEYLKRKSDFGQHMKIPSEMSAGTCWELAIELEQFINTTPPQRTWVGLTKNERLELYRQFEDFLESDDCEYEKAIEQALKERNQ